MKYLEVRGMEFVEFNSDVLIVFAFLFIVLREFLEVLVEHRLDDLHLSLKYVVLDRMVRIHYDHDYSNSCLNVHKCFLMILYLLVRVLMYVYPNLS